MKVWSVIFNVFGILVLFFMLLVFYKTDRLIEKNFEEVRLRYAVDYATEAAFRSALEIEDIGISYTDMAAVNVNPESCLDSFKTLICFSYDMALSEENFGCIENYIPVAVLVANDGYYITNVEEVDDPSSDIVGWEYKLKWGMKKPHIVNSEVFDPGSGDSTVYGVNLHDDKWVGVYEEGGEIRIEYGFDFEDGNRPPIGLTRSVINREVSKRITLDMMYSIEERNILDTNKSFDYIFYLPTELTYQGVNPINKPALIIMLQGVDFAGTQKIDTVSVGGMQAERKNLVVGFKQGGIKYYCYETQLPENMLYNAEYFFEDIRSAALGGYYPHYSYLTKPRV